MICKKDSVSRIFEENSLVQVVIIKMIDNEL